MSSSEYIIEVNETDFQYQVLQYSRQKPVVVDFWAEWCTPCKTLSPLLERLAEEAGGAFRLAKVDVDENPNLALRYNVRSIPIVKGFRLGEVAAEFVGLAPEAQIRSFLREIAPSPTDLTLSKGQSLLTRQAWVAAEKIFREVLTTRSEAPAALLGLAKCLIAQNKAAEAREILRKFPGSREYAAVEILMPLVQALTQTEIQAAQPTLEATYLRALRLVKMGNFEAAMDGLLDLLRENKRYRSGMAHRVLLGIFELLGKESELTQQYQRELAQVLF